MYTRCISTTAELVEVIGFKIEFQHSEQTYIASCKKKKQKRINNRYTRSGIMQISHTILTSRSLSRNNKVGILEQKQSKALTKTKGFSNGIKTRVRLAQFVTHVYAGVTNRGLISRPSSRETNARVLLRIRTRKLCTQHAKTPLRNSSEHIASLRRAHGICLD